MKKYSLLIPAAVALAFALPANFCLAQIETRLHKHDLAIQLPHGELILTTNLNAHSDTGWKAAEIGEVTEDGGDISFTARFLEGENLEFQRKITMDETTLTGSDTWSIDSPLKGHIHYAFNFPMDEEVQATIETQDGAMTIGELSELQEIQYFLRSDGLTTVKIKNYKGADITFTTDPCRFEIMAVGTLRIIHLRFYVDPTSSEINNFTTNWNLEVTEAD
jgi:hypothetical protein